MSDNEDRSDKVEIVPASAIESIERAQIDMQIATAKRYPRDMHKVKKGIESLATIDRSTAEACFYSLPRGGKTIQGPGVRLAEIAVHSFGNVRVQTRVIDVADGGKNPHVTVQAVCADLEKNVAVSIEKRRRIVGKKSKGGQIDEDDINLATNACSAIAFRDAAFKVIPMAIVMPAYEAAKQVAIGDAKTLADRRIEAVARFGKMGVQPDRVCAVLAKSNVDAIDLNDLETLFGLFTAIKDGTTTIDEAFPSVQKVAAGTAGLVDKLKGTVKPSEPASEPKGPASPAEQAQEPATPPPAANLEAEEKAGLVKALMATAGKNIKLYRKCLKIVDLAEDQDLNAVSLDKLIELQDAINAG